MPNTVDLNGLTIQSLPEILDEILAGLRQIYGPDINVDQNSPDGQLANLMALGKIDNLELAKQIYNSLDPDKAIGRALDARAAINGVTRQGATRTVVILTIVVDRVLTMLGTDTSITPFTVSDSTGNKFALAQTTTTVGAGGIYCVFNAVTPGEVLITPYTVNNIVTPQIGVLSATNASTAITQGVDEESDYSLRIRRARSVAIGGKGFLANMYAELYAVADVEQVNIYENNTGSVDANGISAHSILCVVKGGTSADIGAAIYRTINGGCGMDGGTTVSVIQVDGRTFAAKFTAAVGQSLFVSVVVANLAGGAVDVVYLRAQMLAQLKYTINQLADTTSIISIIKAILGNVSVTAEGVSLDGVTYTPIVSPTHIYNYFSLDTTGLKINGVTG